MNNRPILAEKPLHFIHNASLYTKNAPLNSTFNELALTDALLLHASESGESTFHLWESTRPTVLLGMMDTKISHFPQACSSLFNNHYDALVRHSGGLAVPSDAGILNFSLLLKNPLERRLSINEGYQLGLTLLKQAFETEEIKLIEGEVPESYCPGTFDVSISTKKIAGLSQRRVKEGLGIMGYISVTGNQEKRGQLIDCFYKEGQAYEIGETRYPVIHPEVMGTLEQLISSDFTLEKAQDSLLESLRTKKSFLKEHTYSPSVQSLYDESLKKLIKRNKKMMGSLFKKEVFT